jgi:hypothetical protein
MSTQHSAGNIHLIIGLRVSPMKLVLAAKNIMLGFPLADASIAGSFLSL